MIITEKSEKPQKFEKPEKPAIRFDRFVDPWEQRKVGDIFKVTRGYVLAAPETSATSSEEMPYPVYSSQTKNDGLMGFYKDYLYEDAITWTTDGANAGTVSYRAGKFYCTNVCGVLLSEDGYANKMVAEALNAIAWRHVSRVGNPKLMNNVMSEIVACIPKSVEEQKEISGLFESIDALITLQKRKCDKLVKIKKSMLEKMFPRDGADVPEVRFTGFTGAWERRKLGELVDIGDIDHRMPPTVNEGIPYLMIGDFCGINELNFIGVKHVSKEDYEILSRKIKPEKGDIIFARYASVGAVRYVDFDRDFLISYSCAIIKGGNKIDSKFLYHFLTCDSAQSQIKLEINSSSQANIGIDSMKKNINVSMPSCIEQRKISDFLSNLDNLITLHHRECEKYKELKKGLLQQMFV